MRLIWENRGILRSIALSQLRAKYMGTALGAAWGVLNPIAVTLAIIFAFSVVLKINMERFPLFVLAGFFPWNFFSSSVSEASRSFLERKDILRQLDFPRAVAPLAYALAGFADYLRGWIFILPLFAVFNPKVLFFLPWLPVILFLNLFFVCGLCLLVSVMNVYYRDTAHLLNLGLMFWLWTTPIFYTADMIPDRFYWIITFNPLAQFLEAYRAVLFSARAPSVGVLCACSAWACFSAVAGMTVFRGMEEDILKRL
jgi:ABC-2 type transport system permease protein